MSRKASMASTYITEKRISQWEELMRKFSEAHKEECKTVPLDIPRAPRSVKSFPTGSQYQGTWDVLGMSGGGEYTFPNGVGYEGDFEDGMFNGKGELRYNNGAVLRGKWKKGIMNERTLLFSDSLEYSEEKWKYCTMPDRRFAIEYDIDLMPAGKSFLTADQPTKVIPPGYYDAGDGFYCPKTKVVYKYKDLTAIRRSPSAYEQKWIVENCRVSPEEPLGPRPELYEKWSEPVTHPPPTPAPAAGVKSTITTFRQQSIFEQEFEYFEEVREPSTFYDARRASPVGRCFERPLINFKFVSSTFGQPETKRHSENSDLERISNFGGSKSTLNLSRNASRSVLNLSGKGGSNLNLSSRGLSRSALSFKGLSPTESVDLDLHPKRNFAAEV